MGKIHAQVAKPRGRLRLIDATFLKVHQHAANPPGGAEGQGIGRSKGGPTTKLHAVVDEHGTLASLRLTAGNRNDCKVAPELLEHCFQKTILADKAYDTNLIREIIRQKKSVACIPSSPRRRRPLPYDPELYKLRHVVENTFQRLKCFRAIDTRYQKLLKNVQGAVCLGATLLLLGYRVEPR